jgi:predicted metalloprotease with PDZ domain
MVRSFSLLLVILAFCHVSLAQGKHELSFTVSVKDPAAHLYHVEFHSKGLKKDTLIFKLPVWTPGYYQVMNYASNLENLTVKDGKGKDLIWERASENSWKVHSLNTENINISYDVKAIRSFVASSYVDGERGYISPAGMFMHPDGMISSAVTVRVEPLPAWSTVATGLEPVKDKKHTFFAADYDVLYDSPILMGNLESFPPFRVKGIPHYFYAFKPGNFDREKFMGDLQKIVTASSDLIGDIPYQHYSFLAIGPGGGGIEHLNSTSIAFNGEQMKTREGMIRMYNFLAHEYFHHYNVKRIRPVELGPFDYDRGSRTKMLWLSEGVTVYYEYLILKRAGLTTTEELLKELQNSIRAFEAMPGKLFQTVADASYYTWEEGPYGKVKDSVNKTISAYSKGPLIGVLLDLKIRYETKNKRSLDDLMRLLYNKYYKQMGRGFTEDEFRKEAEQLSGSSLQDVFDYVYTLKPLDYPKYLHYAGLSIDTVSQEKSYKISIDPSPDPLQASIQKSWLGN